MDPQQMSLKINGRGEKMEINLAKIGQIAKNMLEGVY